MLGCCENLYDTKVSCRLQNTVVHKNIDIYVVQLKNES